jgi:hypothetical protein
MTRTVVAEGYGGPEVLAVQDIVLPDPGRDLVGTDEAPDTSVELIADRTRIATIAGFAPAPGLGIAVLTEVTVAHAFPVDAAPEAHRYLQTGHARGKVVLVP